MIEAITEIIGQWSDGLITRQERNVKIMIILLTDTLEESQHCYALINHYQKELKK